MQSSVASKVSHLVLRRTPYRRPLSYCRLIQPRILLQTQDNQHNNDHVCIDNQHQPFSIENINSNDNSNNTREQQRHDYQRQPRRIHSTLASKSFWRGLHQAVRQGNGNHAEEIAEQVLRDYYRFSSPSGSEASNSASNSASASAPSINDLSHDYNGTVTIESGAALLDSQIFSLVLQAWKNSDHGSLHSALRAHNLLIQMAALADQDVLCDPPTPGDYAAVLECWNQASENEGNGNGNYDGASGPRRSNSNANGSIALIVQHAEELWSQMKERQRREAMTNKSAHFSIDEEAYELFASLLAKAGKAAQAEQVVREAVAQQQQQQHGGPNYEFANATGSGTGEEHDKNSNNNNNSSNNSNNNNNNSNNNKNRELREEDYNPRVSLNLCHAVLRAHLASKETRASERAEAFLQQMMTDSSLPNPSVDSYNLLLERWMASSKKTRKSDALVDIAGRVEELIHQMKETSRIQPNLLSYQYGIDALARSGEAIRAETMLAHLVQDYLLHFDADLKPNIAPFQSVLWAYSKAATGGQGQCRLADAAKRAESILNNMKELSTLVDTYPTVWSYNIVLKCWAHSNSPDAVARTMALYDELRRAPQEHREANDGDKKTMNFEPESDHSVIHPPGDLVPDTTSMNTVLNVLSRGKNGAIRTERKLLDFYDAHVQEPKTNPRPDTISFSTAINAWSNSSDADSPFRAEALLQKMIDLNDGGNKRSYKPDVVTYTNVMQSWIKSKRPEAPEKSEAILRDLQRMHLDGDKRMKPDSACWNSVISAWATAGNGERAEALFLEMVDGSKTLDSGGGASPTPITLTNVLKAWVRTKSPQASDRAIALLAKMEQYYRDGILDVKPNGVNYSVVLDCLAYSRKSSAAERAERMLQRMEASDDPNMHPSVVSYNSVIKAWSYTRDPRSSTKITALLRILIDRSETNPQMKPNENTFGVILKFLADSDLPDKEIRAKAIRNLMKKFLDREPKQWVMNEFKKCLSSNQVDEDSSFVHCVDTNAKESEERSELPLGRKNDTPDTSKETSDARPNPTATPCRERRANKRFSSEIRKKNLTFQPISGKPEVDEEFRSRSCDAKKFDIRNALVRVRLARQTSLTTPKNQSSETRDKEKNYSFSIVVVDGESEYSCKLLNADRNHAPEIKGGQFLNISYYWFGGEPVIVSMKDAVTGYEITR